MKHPVFVIPIFDTSLTGTSSRSRLGESFRLSASIAFLLDAPLSATHFREGWQHPHRCSSSPTPSPDQVLQRKALMMRKNVEEMNEDGLLIAYKA